jgi:hypothetical protein
MLRRLGWLTLVLSLAAPAAMVFANEAKPDPGKSEADCCWCCCCPCPN